MFYENLLAVKGRVEHVIPFVALLHRKGLAGLLPAPKHVTKHKLWRQENWGPETNIDPNTIRTLMVDGEVIGAGKTVVEKSAVGLTEWLLLFETEGSSASPWFHNLAKKEPPLDLSFAWRPRESHTGDSLKKSGS